jgi:putative DNA primase/helicase
MMTARELTLALGGRWRGNSGSVRCPCHDDRTPSMSIRDGDKPGRVLVHCFAGCRSDDIINELRRQGVLEKPEPGKRWSRRRDHSPRPVEHKPDPIALEMWQSAKPAADSIVETYLRGRAITLLPPSIRVTPTGDLIAAVQSPTGEIIAVQVTQLTAEGKKADVEIPRITTGALGFGAVRLAKAGDILGIAEGIETALSAMQLFNIPVWASLGAARLHRVAIPESVRELHIFGDDGEPGRAAAERTAGVYRARKRVLRFPPKGHKDFNDLLRAKCGRAA